MLPRSLIDDRFEVISPLGEGGMGTVFLCRQLGIERLVAVKLIRHDAENFDDRDARARFEREMHVLRELRHKSIVSVYGYGFHNGDPYMVEEYVKGRSLASMLYSNQALEPAFVLEITARICEALSHAHQCGVIHRDLKPSNIIIAENGDVKLIDFGLAKVLPNSSVKDQQLTEVGTAIGSVLYMSPEQCSGNPAGARSDIYGLGCVVFHCLTGVAPFSGENSVAVMYQHVRSPFLRLKDVISDVVHLNDLQALLDKATAKEPETRYQSAADMLADVTRLRQGLPLQPPGPQVACVTPNKKFRRVPVLLLAFCLSVAMGWFVVHTRKGGINEASSNRNSRSSSVIVSKERADADFSAGRHAEAEAEYTSVANMLMRASSVELKDPQVKSVVVEALQRCNADLARRASVQLGKKYIELGDKDLALALFSLSVDNRLSSAPITRTDSLVVWYTLGELFFGRKQYSEAEHAFSQLEILVGNSSKSEDRQLAMAAIARIGDCSGQVPETIKTSSLCKPCMRNWIWN